MGNKDEWRESQLATGGILMDLTNIKNGLGFDVGQQKDVYYKLFQIYTGDSELYLHICSLLEDIAKQFERGFEADE